jgi:hypothetical protein
MTTPLYMARAMDAVPDDGMVEGFTAYPKGAWDEKLLPYVQAEVRARDRRVRIKRIFLLPKKHGNANIASYLEQMRNHKGRGVDVRYIFHDKFPDEQEFFGGRAYDCALFNKNLFGFDQRLVVYGDEPAESRFSWKATDLDNCPFKKGLWDSISIHEFNDSEEKVISDYYAAAHLRSPATQC